MNLDHEVRTEVDERSLKVLLQDGVVIGLGRATDSTNGVAAAAARARACTCVRMGYGFVALVRCACACSHLLLEALAVAVHGLDRVEEEEVIFQPTFGLPLSGKKEGRRGVVRNGAYVDT